MDARSTSAEDQPSGEDLLGSLIAFAHTLRTQPCHHARAVSKLATELLGILAGSDAQVAPQDPRFTQPGWQWPVQRRALQAWLAWRQHGTDLIEGLELPELDLARLRLLHHHLTEALSPANSPLNPDLIEPVLGTGGRNICDGVRNLARDALLRRPLPAQTEEGALLVGRDLANTCGAVVHRTPLFELIQYQPTTAQVASLPLVIIPPPLNRFYLLDMTPQQSLVRHALGQGLQVFMISWRNPNPSHCNWGFEHYVNAADEALRLACSISNTRQATLLGVCAGGLIGLLLQGYQAANGQSTMLPRLIW